MLKVLKYYIKKNKMQSKRRFGQQNIKTSRIAPSVTKLQLLLILLVVTLNHY